VRADEVRGLRDLLLGQGADGLHAGLRLGDAGAEGRQLVAEAVPLGLALLGECGLAGLLVDRAKGVLDLIQAGLHLFESHFC
jgi:hypothetical protein